MEYRYYNTTDLPEHFVAQGDNHAIAYAKAFGACWAYLDQEAKAKIFRNYGLELPEVENI